MQYKIKKEFYVNVRKKRIEDLSKLNINYFFFYYNIYFFLIFWDKNIYMKYNFNFRKLKKREKIKILTYMEKVELDKENKKKRLI